ncbi:MAG TPA: class I SAM-dependent methyltransferase [Acidimicrobiales bacterium]|nr:class I SAM-dependent methyltransferase [Acidimicrobiales bacterium]
MGAQGDGDDRARNRHLWSLVNEQFTDADAVARWDEDAVTWGLFRIPEADLGLLGDVAGARVAELGAGTAYLSAWLARAGAHPVALDLSGAQLDSARRCQERTGIRFPLVEADGDVLPLATGAFDLVVSEYGAGPWCDPRRWLPEAARVLRPGGRLVFLTNSVLAGLCVPEDAGFAGDRLLRPQRDLFPIAWPEGGVEHHPGHGDWIRLLRAAGFAVEALHELYPPPGAPTHEYYDIVTAAWAQRWPAEDLWVAVREG